MSWLNITQYTHSIKMIFSDKKDAVIDPKDQYAMYMDM